jgi:hypothetical protein
MESVGQLNVRVFTSQAQIPVEGATVVVTGEGKNGKRALWSVQSTDSSGGIRPVSMQTPAVGESTQPGQDEAPFAVCQVWAEHPGFAVLAVDGVQVFPGVETLQEMELIPLAQGESSLSQPTQRRDISAQDL